MGRGTIVGRWGLLLLAGLALMTGPAALAQPPAAGAVAAPFPDVPPWHWAHAALVRDAQAGLLVGYPASPPELVANSITQVYDGFAHAGAPVAREWVERFTYNRPASWPGPLERSAVASFVLRGITSVVAGDTATARFVAEVTPRTGRSTATPMRVTLRLVEGDWKVDYATLASGSPWFR